MKTYNITVCVVAKDDKNALFLMQQLKKRVAYYCEVYPDSYEQTTLEYLVEDLKDKKYVNTGIKQVVSYLEDKKPN